MWCSKINESLKGIWGEFLIVDYVEWNILVCCVLFYGVMFNVTQGLLGTKRLCYDLAQWAEAVEHTDCLSAEE